MLLEASSKPSSKCFVLLLHASPALGTLWAPHAPSLTSRSSHGAGLHKCSAHQNKHEERNPGSCTSPPGQMLQQRSFRKVSSRGWERASRNTNRLFCPVGSSRERTQMAVYAKRKREGGRREGGRVRGEMRKKKNLI